MRRILIGVAAIAAVAASVPAMAVSASAAATPAPHKTLIHTVVGDYYGNPSDAIGPASQASPDACANPGSQRTSFTTSIPSNWQTLDARRGPFQGCAVKGEWHTGDAFHVSRITYGGQTICLHPSLHSGPASSVWYLTPKGWSWSGGTSDAVWNTSCQ